MPDRAVLLRLEAIEHRLAQLEGRRPKVSPVILLTDDVRFLTVALPVIGGALGSSLFTLKDLMDARGHSQALAQVLTGSPSSLGQLFARHHGRPVGGHVIEKVGREGARVVWKVSKVANLHDALDSSRIAP